MADTSEPPEGDPREGAQPEATAATPTPAKNKGSSDAWLGGVLWVAIIAGAVYFSLRSTQVDVLLNASGTDPIVAEGVVTNEGAPVIAGTIQVLVEEPRGERLLGSAVADVSPKGTFRLEVRRSESARQNSDGLKIRGVYQGRATGANNETKALSGASTVYLNMTPPWGMSWGLGALAIVIGGLVVLFTGPLPPRKARLLFGVTYVVTFSACVIPIILTVAASRSPALLQTMRDAPVGIINAKAKGLEEAQWLVNIGGSVNQVSTEESGAGGRLLPAGTPTALVSVEPTAPVATDAANPAAKAPDGTTATVDNSVAAAKTSDIPKTVTVPVKVEPLGFEVKGGLAIPLYVIVLAMLGAGINMTRKVPQIQTDYDSKAAATFTDALSAPAKVFRRGADTDDAEPNHPKDPSQIRQELIETYMYFLSAPFLAIAVYYLLQIVASSVAEPVLVVIAFASGLMSESAVGAIMKFADDFLKRQQEKDPAVEALPAK